MPLAHHVYLARCGDGSLYTGYAVDVGRRIAAHNAGMGGRYTRSHRPVTLIATWGFATKGEALRARSTPSKSCVQPRNSPPRVRHATRKRMPLFLHAPLSPMHTSVPQRRPFRAFRIERVDWMMGIGRPTSLGDDGAQRFSACMSLRLRRRR